MKRFVKSVLFVVLTFVTTMPAWGQSTQGKEFWVSASVVCTPTKNQGVNPYIAISTEKACKVHIKGGVNNAIDIEQELPAGSWNEFGHQGKAQQRDPKKGQVFVNMDASAWYPVDVKEPATVCNLAGQKFMYGLHITSTEDISVYVIIRGEASMDASNILPLTALGSEYYMQDYKPEAHNEDSWSTNAGNMVTVTTILGTENNTVVDIEPNGTTYDGHSTKYNITLNQGQIYYLISKKENQLTGSHIKAREERKIAIYTSSPLTRLPNGISARDALFEQPLPIDYWGTQFVATRSLRKNGNLIGITAMMNETRIYLGEDKRHFIELDEGDTYYIMLQGPNEPHLKKPGTGPVDTVFTADVLYINASCPCSVYNYDTGQSYENTSDPYKALSELTDANAKGDPSSVWVSSLEQKINKITFGACYTDLTRDHFLNVVAETEYCNQTVLKAFSTNDSIDKSGDLNWIKVPGNPAYSYARAQIGNNASEDYSVFRMENPQGLIATIYGHGHAESYAYSAGSSAVSLGSIVVGDTVFKDGGFYQKGFCVNDVLTFDASAGTTVIDKVVWDFGDGTSETVREATVEHEYTVKGWYDVTAKLYAHKECPDTVYPPFNVSFTFRVNEPPTIQKKPTKLCMPEDYDGPMDSIGTITYDCDSIVVTPYFFGKESSYQYNDTARDVAIINGVEYTSSQDVTWNTENEWNCPHHITCHLVVVKCLDLQINNDPDEQHTCMGENYELPFSVDKDGFAGKAYLVRWGDGQRTEINLENTYVEGTRVIGTTTLPIDEWPAGKYSVQVLVRDSNCHYDAYSPELNITVNYPQDVFARKFNNVLAVYAPGNGGNIGYDFRSFQWYRNGEAIWGANNAVYYSEQPFQVGETYYIELTDAQGLTLPSCEMIITEDDIEDYTGGSSNAPKAEKKLVNQQLRIVIDDREYDMYGQRVE